MTQIKIISSSIRIGKNSSRVAVYLKNYITENNLASVEILDLDDYNFPIFNERLSLQENPSEKAMDFAEKINSSDAVIIVSPEYNGSYPASLKNVIDLLYAEWNKKPIGLATVSSGSFAGTQVTMTLQSLLWKIKALVSSTTFPVSKVESAFDEIGVAFDKENTDRKAANFIKELTWLVEAKQKMM